MGGFGFLLRWNFWTGTRVSPYVDGGAGLGYSDTGQPEEGGHFGFQLEVGLGVHVLLADPVALTFEYRFHHFSNADIYLPNFGINQSQLMAGVSLYF
jgi:opacity protein-like surface antigen